MMFWAVKNLIGNRCIYDPPTQNQMQIPQLQQWEMFAITGKIWSCITRMPQTKLHILRRWKLMQIKRYSDGSMKLYIDDEDKYDVTDDNGVDVWLTKEQVRRIRENPWPLKPSPTAPSVPASKSAMHISQEAFTGIRKVWIHAKCLWWIACRAGFWGWSHDPRTRTNKSALASFDFFSFLPVTQNYQNLFDLFHNASTKRCL